MRNRRTAAVAAIALTLACAGCGSSSSSSTTANSAASSGTTPAAYRAQVGKACDSVSAQIRALPVNTTSTISGLKKIDAIDVAALNQIKAIKAPGALQGQVSHWLGIIGQESALSQKILAALDKGQVSQAQAVAAQGKGLDQQGNAAARALGLPACAASPRPQGA